MLLNKRILEHARFQRICRGYGTAEDFACKFEEVTKHMSPAEKEIFRKQMASRQTERVKNG